MDKCKDSIQTVVHEDNEECGWEQATLRYTVPEDLFPALVLLVLYLSFLFSRFFTNHIILSLIRRSITFPREFGLIRRSITFTTEVVEAHGFAAICLGSHFYLFVDWYQRGWEHAKYTIFCHSSKDLVQYSKYTDMSYSKTKLQPSLNFWAHHY